MKILENISSKSDEELVEAIVSTNNTLLFETLYDRYSSLVYTKCYGFAKNENEAKDLTQDVFLKLFIKLASFKGESKFSTWLYSFTYNHCVNYVTRNTAKKFEKQSVDYKDIENLSSDDDLTDHSILSMKVDQLKIALELISPEEKMILLLKYQENLSGKEIEKILNIGSSAVKMRIKRAKEKLIKVYNKNVN